MYYGNNSVTVDEEVLAAVTSAILSSGAGYGELTDADLFFAARNARFGSVSIALADAGGYYEEQRLYIFAGVFIVAVVLVALFGVSLLLAGLFVKPVRDAWEQQQTFVADASHELKTPLTVILANTEILRSHPDSTVAEQEQWVDSTLEEAQGMKSLVDKLLYLAKSDAKKIKTENEEVDLSELVFSSVLQFEPVAFENGVETDSDIDQDIRITCDRDQIRRLTHILLDNAVKYAGGNGRVFVSLKRSDKHAELSVNNTGAPIPPEDLPHLFERFYRSDKARTAGGGYGLGLAIAKTIADANGAAIRVSSSERDGTTFRVRF